MNEVMFWLWFALAWVVGMVFILSLMHGARGLLSNMSFPGAPGRRYDDPKGGGA